MRKYFITGALVLVPLAITAWVLNFVISTLDQSLVLVPSEWQPRTYIPGLGAIITLAIVFLTGVLTNNLVGKWFVFWASGVRLLLAGLRQAASPAFTAKTIFEIDEPKAFAVVRELGFANIAMGLLGVSVLLRPDWLLPAAIATGLYYLFAGALHVLQPTRNRIETWAMVSDLGIFLVLAIVAVLRLAGGH